MTSFTRDHRLILMTVTILASVALSANGHPLIGRPIRRRHFPFPVIAFTPPTTTTTTTVAPTPAPIRILITTEASNFVFPNDTSAGDWNLDLNTRVIFPKCASDGCKPGLQCDHAANICREAVPD